MKADNMPQKRKPAAYQAQRASNQNGSHKDHEMTDGQNTDNDTSGQAHEWSVGDRFVTRSDIHLGDITHGRVYTVHDVENYKISFHDDVGDKRDWPMSWCVPFVVSGPTDNPWIIYDASNPPHPRTVVDYVSVTGVSLERLASSMPDGTIAYRVVTEYVEPVAREWWINPNRNSVIDFKTTHPDFIHVREVLSNDA